MSDNFFDNVLNNTGSPKIISENHDANQIDTTVEQQQDAQRVSSINNLREWDKSEYGVSREQAVELSKTAEGREELKRRALARANLNVSKGKVSMFSARETPWHKLGIVVSDALVSSDALKMANLNDWDLMKLPVYSRFPGFDLQGNPVQHEVEVPDIYSIVRGDTHDVLGHVGPRYEIFTNEECFSFMDEVIKGGAKWETAGALGKGETVWMLAQFPQFAVKGDEYNDYIICGTSHDGSSAIWVYPTKTRVVCQNTYRRAGYGKRAGIYFRHTKNVREKAEQARKALQLCTNDTKEFQAKVTHLANSKLDKPSQYFHLVLDDILDVTVAGQKLKGDNYKEVFNSVMAMTDIEERNSMKKLIEKSFVRRKELLQDMISRYNSERCNSGEFEGTAYAAYNAVTEHADHSTKWKENTDEVRRFNSILNGQSQNIKEIALEKVLELTK